VKAFLIGVCTAAVLAVAAAAVLDGRFQREAETHFQTEGVRL
jgi:hypothetical protein